MDPVIDGGMMVEEGHHERNMINIAIVGAGAWEEYIQVFSNWPESVEIYLRQDRQIVFTTYPQVQMVQDLPHSRDEEVRVVVASSAISHTLSKKSDGEGVWLTWPAQGCGKMVGYGKKRILMVVSLIYHSLVDRLKKMVTSVSWEKSIISIRSVSKRCHSSDENALLLRRITSPSSSIFLRKNLGSFRPQKLYIRNQRRGVVNLSFPMEKANIHLLVDPHKVKGDNVGSKDGGLRRYENC
jgi:hypothetical protein